MATLDFLMAYPVLAWLGVAAILLAIEVATGSGWLLWAAGAAGAVCIVVLFAPIGAAWQLALFAVLAILSGLAGRRFLPGSAPGEDINDNAARLVGRQARVVAAFAHGRGRVVVDGKEWAAVLAAGQSPALGEMVTVAAADGAELNVTGS